MKEIEHKHVFMANIYNIDLLKMYFNNNNNDYFNIVMSHYSTIYQTVKCYSFVVIAKNNMTKYIEIERYSDKRFDLMLQDVEKYNIYIKLEQNIYLF